MSDLERLIREQAYRLWEQAGRPFGRSDEFWYAAQQEYQGASPADRESAMPLAPLAEEPPAVLAQHGTPAGMPGERIAEQGVLDGGLEGLALPDLADTDDD